MTTTEQILADYEARYPKEQRFSWKFESEPYLNLGDYEWNSATGVLVKYTERASRGGDDPVPWTRRLGRYPTIDDASARVAKDKEIVAKDLTSRRRLDFLRREGRQAEIEKALAFAAHIKSIVLSHRGGSRKRAAVPERSPAIPVLAVGATVLFGPPGGERVRGKVMGLGEKLKVKQLEAGHGQSKGAVWDVPPSYVEIVSGRRTTRNGPLRWFEVLHTRDGHTVVVGRGRSRKDLVAIVKQAVQTHGTAGRLEVKSDWLSLKNLGCRPSCYINVAGLPRMIEVFGIDTV